MRLRKTIFCSAVAGFVAFTAIACCCPKTAQAAIGPGPAHSCCPQKSDATPDQQCPHQFIKGERANLASFEPYYSDETTPAPIVSVRAFVPQPSFQVSLAIDSGQSSVSEVPLYLQSHKLRL